MVMGMGWGFGLGVEWGKRGGAPAQPHETRIALALSLLSQVESGACRGPAQST